MQPNKLTRSEIAWLTSRGGRITSDIIDIDGVLFVEMVGEYRTRKIVPIPKDFIFHMKEGRVSHGTI